ncbi:hypothetical protein [Actinocorallia longicatena]|uniref:SH3 domain-containing protein n=1 Tax=Actinocorallia longicatena TaxID=111803 RepID=A0ABP6QFI3_9ACTN
MRSVVMIAAFPLLLALSSPAAASEEGGRAKTHYTHSTTLKRDCPIYENYPKSSVPARSWTKKRKKKNGGLARVGVRYTYKRYALVLDYARKADPSWGFIAQSCLKDPHAYSEGDHGVPLPSLRAIGGNGVVKDVPISAPHTGKKRKTLIHLDSRGSVRSGARSFVIGNARKGDPFYITKTNCGSHSAQAWILGYAPTSGRWGYIQASHLPACR